jgi:hypothetical protein
VGLSQVPALAALGIAAVDAFHQHVQRAIAVVADAVRAFRDALGEPVALNPSMAPECAAPASVPVPFRAHRRFCVRQRGGVRIETITSVTSSRSGSGRASPPAYGQQSAPPAAH